MVMSKLNGCVVKIIVSCLQRSSNPGRDVRLPERLIETLYHIDDSVIHNAIGTPQVRYTFHFAYCVTNPVHNP
jgi:hypothetical protein